jgi:hypothetical protein
MPGQITELALVKAQRDQLAVNLHDLHVLHQMTLAALAETNQRLGTAEARVVELETPLTNEELSQRARSAQEIIKQHQALAAGSVVNTASDADADAAA